MIKKVLFLFILLSLPLLARQYNSTLLDIEAKLFPKMALLENYIKTKKSDVLSIVIISEDVDISVAKKLKMKILSNYPNTLLNKKVTVDITQAHTINQANIDALIMLYHPIETLKRLALWANEKHVVTFAYDASDLDYGLLGSIYIGTSAKPYLNPEIIKEYNFVFDSYLLQLSKFKD